MTSENVVSAAPKTAESLLKVGIVYDRSHKSRGGHGTHLAFRGLPVRSVALVDAEADGIREAQAKVGAERVYGDWREMMDRERPDIVVLGSRDPVEHWPPLLEAVRRGIHVLVEKPLCTTLEEADALLALSKKTGSRICVAHLARYAVLFRTMKRMLEEGAVGTPLSVYGRGKEDERGGGEDMLVLGTHVLDVMCWLFGMPERLFAEVTVNGAPLRPSDRSTTSEPLGPVAGDNVFAHLHFPGGVRGFFESRKGIYQPGNQVRMGLTVVGTKGALSMRYTNGQVGEGERQLRLTRSSYPAEDAAEYEVVPLPEDVAIAGAEPLVMDFIPYFSVNNRLAAWDLVQAIREGREPRASAADAAAVLEIIQGIYRSQLEGRRIDFPLTDRRHPLSGS